MSIKKKVLSGVKWTTIATVVLASTAIIKISILTRFLDKADFGLMAYVTFVMGLMDLFNNMGLTSAILHKQNITKKEYASLYWFNLLISFGMYALLFLITPLLSTFFEQEELIILIPLLGLNLITSGIGHQFKVILQKHLRFKELGFVDMSTAILSLSIAVYLAVNGYGVYSLVYSSLIQVLISNIAYLLLGLHKQGLLFHFHFDETKPFLKIGGYQVGGQVVNYFNRDVDILLIGKFFSPEILGGYSLAKQLVYRPSQLINPILVKVASPTLALFQDDKLLLKKNYLRLLRIVSTINIPVYLGVLLFSPWIVEILYGQGFDDIVVLVRVLSIYMIFRAIGNPVGSLLIATGRTDLGFIWNLVVLLVLPLFIFIGSQFGILEVTIAITIAMVILYVPSWKILVNKLIGASLGEYLHASFVIDFKFIKDRISRSAFI